MLSFITGCHRRGKKETKGSTWRFNRSTRSAPDDLVPPIVLELPFDPVTSEDGRVKGSARRSNRSAPDDLICPITLELPFDPVTAEDGRVYEKTAIQQHFEDKHEVRSPLTNETIGKRLFPAPQHKNLIETLIEEGVIAGDLADNWQLKQQEKFQEKRQAEAWIRGAEQGDVGMMKAVALCFLTGANEFPTDHEKAFKWGERGYNAGNPELTGMMGLMLAKGYGTAKNERKGLVLLVEGAEKGSVQAPLYLGQGFAHGLFGLDVDKAEANKWLKKAASIGPRANDLMRDDVIDEAQKLLDQIRDEVIDEAQKLLDRLSQGQ